MTAWEYMFWTGITLAAICVIGTLMTPDRGWEGLAVVGVAALILIWTPILFGGFR